MDTITFTNGKMAVYPASSNVEIVLHVNGRNKKVLVQAHWTLLEVLREFFQYTGAKEACNEGACGACTVNVDGVPTLACMTLAVEMQGHRIETIEGISNGDDLHPLQDAWLEEYGAQCGFCSPGMIMSAKGFLERHPDADEEEIKEALAGNICICGNYEHILKSVLKGAERMKQEFIAKEQKGA